MNLATNLVSEPTEPDPFDPNFLDLLGGRSAHHGGREMSQRDSRRHAASGKAAVSEPGHPAALYAAGGVGARLGRVESSRKRAMVEARLGSRSSEAPVGTKRSKVTGVGARLALVRIGDAPGETTSARPVRQHRSGGRVPT